MAPKRRNIKLTISYCGTGYHGWQRQAGHLSVQQVIEEAIERMTGERICLKASGRTDAGVHAIGQVASFRTGSTIPLEGFLKGLNSILPGDIAILRAEDVPWKFHPIADAVSKTYCYHLISSRSPLPLWRKRAWIIDKSLDYRAMKQALAYFVGTRDFSAFRASGSSVKNAVRTVHFCDIEVMTNSLFPPTGGRHFLFTIAANGFLRYMVRNIVGLVVDIGLGRRKVADVVTVLASRDRSMAGPTAPAHGLYLMEVVYDSKPSSLHEDADTGRPGRREILTDKEKADVVDSRTCRAR